MDSSPETLPLLLESRVWLVASSKLSIAVSLSKMIFEFSILNPCYRVKELPLLATCNNFSKEGKGIELVGS